MNLSRIALGIAVSVGVAQGLYARVKQGPRLLTVRERSSKPKLAVAGVLMAVLLLAAIGSSGRAGSVLALVTLVGLVLSQLGFAAYGPPPKGFCAFHQKGVLLFDGQRHRFTRWDGIERFEWQGDTLMLHLMPEGLAHVGEIRAVDVPPEGRGEVMAVIAPRLRG